MGELVVLYFSEAGCQKRGKLFFLEGALTLTEVSLGKTQHPQTSFARRLPQGRRFTVNSVILFF